MNKSVKGRAETIPSERINQKAVSASKLSDWLYWKSMSQDLDLKWTVLHCELFSIQLYCLLHINWK